MIPSREIPLRCVSIDFPYAPDALKMAAKRRNAKILLVDDEDYNLAALKIILKYHVNIDVDKYCDEASNGE